MQAIEATGTIDDQGQLLLDQPLQIAHLGKVRVIVLLSESEHIDFHRDQSNDDPLLLKAKGKL
jgi:hypothetical protein